MLKIIFSQALAILAQCGHWSSDCDYWCFRNGKSSLRSSVELRERNFQVSEEPLKQQAGSERGKTSFITYCAAITKAKTGASILCFSTCILSSGPVVTRCKLRWVTKTWGCHIVEGDPALAALWTLGSWKDEQLGVGKYWILNQGESFPSFLL